MTNIALVDAFDQQWKIKVEDCEGRLETQRGNFEYQHDSLDKLFFTSFEMAERSQQTEAKENIRQNLDPIFLEKSAEKLVESLATSEHKFIDSIVGDIKKNVEAVRLLINEFNEEYDLLKEVLSKSISEKIKEVREEERMKAALEKEQAI